MAAPAVAALAGVAGFAVAALAAMDRAVAVVELDREAQDIHGYSEARYTDGVVAVVSLAGIVAVLA